jgi:hypothetical protein
MPILAETLSISSVVSKSVKVTPSLLVSTHAVLLLPVPCLFLTLSSMHITTSLTFPSLKTKEQPQPHCSNMLIYRLLQIIVSVDTMLYHSWSMQNTQKQRSEQIMLGDEVKYHRDRNDAVIYHVFCLFSREAPLFQLRRQRQCSLLSIAALYSCRICVSWTRKETNI